MLRFSLVIATIGRTSELEYLLSSLAHQQYRLLECILVDQNEDDRVRQIAAQWSHSLNIKVLTSAPGLSRARNVGLAAATGHIVAFPDDDCWYTPNLLADVSAWFRINPEYDILTVGATDHDGSRSGNRWLQSRCNLHPINIFRTTFSSTLFIRRNAFAEGVRFDEQLGVGSGSPFRSGEETDFVLALLRRGARGYFDRRFTVGHPRRDMLSAKVDGARAVGYGRGMGKVLRKHELTSLATLLFLYDLMRAGLVALKADFEATRLCLLHARGISSGFLAGALKRESALKEAPL